MDMEAMKERSIIFKQEMVRAILDGRKTQTRRVMRLPENQHQLCAADNAHDLMQMFKCPYGQLGNQLWVRESFGYMWPDNCEDGRIYDDTHFDGRPIEKEECRIVYKATEPDALWAYEGQANVHHIDDDEGSCLMWRSPRFMPRIASRLILRITDIRVERVHDITPAQAIAEGVTTTEKTIVRFHKWENLGLGERMALDAFADLWNSINAKRGYGWDINPWVWVIVFERYEQEQKQAVGV